MSSTLFTVSQLPAGDAPEALSFRHFPSRLHALVWRNWTLVPPDRLAAVVGATSPQVRQLAESMGLSPGVEVSADVIRRSAITVIRRNWHLLPYEQLLTLLNWTADELAFALREDDFLYIKLGRLKPTCEPIRYKPPSVDAQSRASRLGELARSHFGDGFASEWEPHFRFIEALREPPREAHVPGSSAFSPRYCSSYFGLYGDPLLDLDTAGFPEGYLAQLAASGVDGVWIQGLLSRLAPSPWQPDGDPDHLRRLANLRELIDRAGRVGLSVYLYLNEPRAHPLSFFDAHPEWRGVEEDGYAALCTSASGIEDYLSNATEYVCRNAPGLGGIFTISASENLTNCQSRGRGDQCPRCAARGLPDVIAGVSRALRRGIDRANSSARLIAWDWGWPDDRIAEIVRLLPDDISVMSVNEWRIPIVRGGVESEIGEYSLSAIGPGPRARETWRLAAERGLRCLAKIQAASTWELSATPYIPVPEITARNVAALRTAGVSGLMLGWTLGGCPSANLEVAAQAGAAPLELDDESVVELGLRLTAERHFGPVLRDAMVTAWKRFSRAFQEFPFHIGVVYEAPLQYGPTNLLWDQPTGYHSTMLGFPYDDLDRWRRVFPAEVFSGQLRKVAEGFESAAADAQRLLNTHEARVSPQHRTAAQREMVVAEACAIHFASVANQTEFVALRDQREPAGTHVASERAAGLMALCRAERELAVRLFRLRAADSRLGFEASNQYFYTPLDLVEKLFNCLDLEESLSG